VTQKPGWMRDISEERASRRDLPPVTLRLGSTTFYPVYDGMMGYLQRNPNPVLACEERAILDALNGATGFPNFRITIAREFLPAFIKVLDNVVTCLHGKIDFAFPYDEARREKAHRACTRAVIAARREDAKGVVEILADLAAGDRHG